MTENKRKHLRVRSLNLLYLGVYEKNVLIKQGIGRTLDVSESGIKLETHFPVDPKKNVQLSIGLKDEIVEIKGRSVRTVQGSREKYEIGIKFNRLKKSSLEVVKKYITAFMEEKKKKGK
ncbi:MAG: PilZ domain-containing protein [Proteobacteria bacterium]|nr:PilZ domain-containing protein [Pseudomonadota bacterium]